MITQRMLYGDVSFDRKLITEPTKDCPQRGVQLPFSIRTSGSVWSTNYTFPVRTEQTYWKVYLVEKQEDLLAF